MITHKLISSTILLLFVVNPYVEEKEAFWRLPTSSPNSKTPLLSGSLFPFPDQLYRRKVDLAYLNLTPEAVQVPAKKPQSDVPSYFRRQQDLFVTREMKKSRLNFAIENNQVVRIIKS